MAEPRPRVARKPRQTLRRRSTKQPWIVAGSAAGVLVVALVFLLPPWLRQRQARHDVQHLAWALNTYVQENGRPPEGTLAELATILRGKSLRGQNTKRLDYIEAEVGELSRDGEFVDPWGTPYRLLPRVYSCGPNRRDEAGAGDDLVAGK